MKCPICGSENNKVCDEIPYRDIILGKYVQSINKCIACSFVWSEIPQLEERKTWYKQESQYCDDFYFGVPELSQWNKERWKFQFEFICNNISIDKPFYVMEIGAASGYNLSLWKSCADVLAIEPSKICCKAISEKYNISCFQGTFQDYIESNDKMFDLVICAHVLEHIIDPEQFILNIRKCTKKYVYIEIPTFNERQTDGNRGVFVDEHVNYFTKETLSFLMEKCGFGLCKMMQDTIHERAWGEPIMSIWEKKKNNNLIPLPAKSMTEENYIYEDNLKMADVNYKFNSIDINTRVALYNVGNHAAKKLFARYDFEKLNIVRVYDSEKRLYGRKIFGKKIEPFNAENVRSGEVEKIIICNSFSQQFIVHDLERLGFGDKLICLF